MKEKLSYMKGKQVCLKENEIWAPRIYPSNLWHKTQDGGFYSYLICGYKSFDAGIYKITLSFILEKKVVGFYLKMR